MGEGSTKTPSPALPHTPTKGMPRSRLLRFILSIVALVSLIAYLVLHYGQSNTKLPESGAQEVLGEKANNLGFVASPKSLKAVRNSTLGFEQIFVVNSPERGDKLDAFTLASSITGFVSEVINRVHGSHVQNKTLPSTDHLPQIEWKRNYMIGQWRTHVNFARRILQESLSTALVLTDTSDWSIYLKSQLELFAEGTQYILSSDSNSRSTPHSPYGDGWDLLWLGHCGSSIKEKSERRFVIENDNTVPLPDHRSVFSNSKIDMMKEGFDDRTRVVYEADGGSCVYAYALSAAGAQKMVQFNSNMKKFEAIDDGLAIMCKEQDSFRCLSVFPNLVDSYTPAGGEREGEEKSTHWINAHTFNILHSQQMTVDKALRGDELKDGRDWRQWSEEPMVQGPPRTRTMTTQRGQ